jgi:hypothetical protein
MPAKGRASAGRALAIATAAVLLTASAASAEHRASGRAGVRHLPHAFERTYGYVPRQVPGQAPRYGSHTGVFSSDAQGRQSYPNPDRDFSIENLSSHAY